jgi:outer membrane protein assembly factor BamB
MKPGSTALRLWPGVVAAVLLVLVRFVVPAFVPGSGGAAMMGGLAAGLAVLIWWLFFSRAPWADRIGAILLMALAIAATSLVVHPSIANGMMGLMLPVFAIPLVTLALVVSVAAGRHLSNGSRRASMSVAILLACAVMTVVRTDGITGDGESDLHWRWTPTPEELLLAQTASGSGEASPDEPAAPAPVPTAAAKPAPPSAPVPAPAVEEPAVLTDSAVMKTDADWPGFRGPARDGVVHGVQIETDWSVSPPVEMWRRPVGPGWSSFAVHGDLIYTQEQRGEAEVVSCYRLTTGEPVWTHGDAVRFWESNGGAGPRATPTLAGGRVYTLGATGILNALDARDGAVVWSRNAVNDTAKDIPDWGIASSPLVVNDVVVVAVAGQLAAYDAATGEPRWSGPAGGGGYSSPHLLTIDGVPQILLSRGARTTSVAPASGALLWEDSWQPAVSIVQPALTADGDVLVTAGDAMGGIGMRRISVARGPDGWTVEERWTSRGLKPYYNDFVVHDGHAFGFDGSILACIDVADGLRTWKGGRYGHGQLLLLPDQDVLLVLSEEGELALVSATRDEFAELARFPAIDGKTWNHPVLVGDVLLVRNDREMAAFRLPVAGR